MKKALSLILILMLALCACAAAEHTNIAALKGPTAMGMVEMMQANTEEYRFEICASADLITPKLSKGEIDIAALPANLASVLYNRTDGGIRVLAINTLGVLYIAERGEGIQSVADLRGKTIYSAGKGSTPEYALNYILRANGLNPGEDVFIEYKSEHSECLAALLNDAEAAAMLPQPFLTTAMTKAEDVRMALDLSAEWAHLQPDGGSAMITGVVAARSEFIDQHPEAIEQFLKDYAASVEYTNSHTDQAAQWIGEYDIVSAEVAQKALPYCNICFIAGDEMRAKLSAYLNVLYEANPESVGGALPDGAFYYGAE